MVARGDSGGGEATWVRGGGGADFQSWNERVTGMKGTAQGM